MKTLHVFSTSWSLILLSQFLLAQEPADKSSWQKYDFVAGDKIIFEDQLTGEKMGEFPSRWDLLKGAAEVARQGDANVISFSQSSEIRPLMKTEKYLPQIFTLEFDVLFYKKYNEAYSIVMGTTGTIDIRLTKVSMGTFSGVPEGASKEAGWHHIAVSFNTRALKVYMDQYRLINIPNIATPPSSFVIKALSFGTKNGEPAMIKNIRLAEGGSDLYDRVMADGKFITRGILFDVNKATIKPESYGTINEIVKLMNDHPDLKFSVEGHTDSDGDETSNMKLSEQRTQSVVEALVSQGIDQSRLSSKGLGEAKPIDSNSTPEGKANNRRVEFVKI